MADATVKSGMNYFSTYLMLVKDYVAYLGLRGIPITLGVVAAGLIYPLPFAIMAAAVYAMMAGHHTWAINFQGWNLVVDVNSAFLYALALAGLSLTFNYFMQRLALTANTSWQTALLWRAINQLPVMARWDTDTAVPLPLKMTRLGPFLTTIVRSGFLIGRIVAIGLPDFVITVGALFVLSWLDPISVLVLIGVALFTLPLYGWGMLNFQRWCS